MKRFERARINGLDFPAMSTLSHCLPLIVVLAIPARPQGSVRAWRSTPSVIAALIGHRANKSTEPLMVRACWKEKKEERRVPLLGMRLAITRYIAGNLAIFSKQLLGHFLP